jgi:hypothetical protein
MLSNNEKTESTAELCTEVALTPEQCNAVLEDKLGHLKPVLECALVTFQRVEETLANGGVNWRKLFKRARERASS